jgi:hypothetical protein
MLTADLSQRGDLLIPSHTAGGASAAGKEPARKPKFNLPYTPTAAVARRATVSPFSSHSPKSNSKRPWKPAPSPEQRSIFTDSSDEGELSLVQQQEHTLHSHTPPQVRNLTYNLSLRFTGVPSGPTHVCGRCQG